MTSREVSTATGLPLGSLAGTNVHFWIASNALSVKPQGRPRTRAILARDPSARTSACTTTVPSKCSLIASSEKLGATHLTHVTQVPPFNGASWGWLAHRLPEDGRDSPRLASHELRCQAGQLKGPFLRQDPSFQWSLERWPIP
jgi:hypothetical protein